MAQAQRPDAVRKQGAPKSTISVVQSTPSKKPVARHGKTGGPERMIAAAIVILIIIIVAVYAALPGTPVSAIGSSGQSFVIAPNHDIYFSLPSGGGVKALFVSSSSNGTATLYVGTVPVLASPVVEVTLAAGSGSGSSAPKAVNMSSGAGTVADMHLSLVSSNSSSAKVEITPIETSLGIAPSKGTTVVLPAIFAQNSAGGFKLTYNYSNATITVVATTTSASTITTKSVTVTVGPSLAPVSQVMELANSTAIGTLMNKFAALYVKDASCNATTYNASYMVVHHYAPSPQNASDWYNESKVVAYGMNTTITHVSGGIYEVNYNIESHYSFFNKVGAILTLNLSNTLAPVINFTTHGYYGSGANVSQLTTKYQQEGSIANNCGAWVT